MHARSLSRFGTLALFLACFLLRLPAVASAQVSSFTVSPANVTAGSEATATVTLSAPAPAGGATVLLSSSNNYAAGVPGSLVIPEGSTSGMFQVATSYVTSTERHAHRDVWA